jgi:hypothetical protein
MERVSRNFVRAMFDVTTPQQDVRLSTRAALVQLGEDLQIFEVVRKVLVYRVGVEWGLIRPE